MKSVMLMAPASRILYFLSVAQQPRGGQGLVNKETSQSYSNTPHSVGLLWTRNQPVSETSTNKTQHTQETDIHALGGIRTRSPNKRAAADLRLRPRGHRDRQCLLRN